MKSLRQYFISRFILLGNFTYFPLNDSTPPLLTYHIARCGEYQNLVKDNLLDQTSTPSLLL